MKIKFNILILSFIFLTSAVAISAEEIVTVSTKEKEKVEKVDLIKKTNLKYNETLRRGIKNNSVLELQIKLKELGYYNLSLDSNYGSGTETAVVDFQRDNGLIADGIAGPKTFAKILGTNNTFTNTEIIDDAPALCTLEYVPVCGQKIVNCVTSPCPQPQPETFGNKCSLHAAGAKYLYSGECQLTKPIEMDIPCTREYEPVCGVNGTDIKTFSNKCVLNNSDYIFRSTGECKLESNTQVVQDGTIEGIISSLEAEINRMEIVIKELQSKIEILKKEL